MNKFIFVEIEYLKKIIINDNIFKQVSKDNIFFEKYIKLFTNGKFDNCTNQHIFFYKYKNNIYKLKICDEYTHSYSKLLLFG